MQAASVGEAPAAQAELLSALAPYPNPMKTSGALSFTLSEPARVILSAYDMAGRPLLHIEKTCAAGTQQIGLTSIPNIHGAILLRAEAESEHGTQTKSTIVVLE
jgi:hypothetical protein